MNQSNDSGLNLDHLEACPFCGAPDPAMHPNDLAENGRGFANPHAQATFAHCDGCGAEGPQAFVEWEARELWNRRAALANPPAPTVPAVNPQPIGYITTGDIEYGSDGAEVGDWDIEFDRKVIDAMPEFAQPETTYAVYLEAVPGAHQPAQEQAGKVTILAECEMFGSAEVEQDARDRVDVSQAAQQEPVAAPQQPAAPGARPNMAYIDKIAPQHSRTSCGDERPINERFGPDDLGGCYRCTLLRAAQLDGGQERSESNG